MEKVELKIIDIKDSVANKNFYNVILKEKKGPKGIVIVIGFAEAQSIAIALDGDMKSKRPLTHDLFYNVCETFDINIFEILINEIKEGVYHSVLICKKDELYVEVDSRTSDALALALRFNCPIYIKKSILNEIGADLELNQEQTVEEFEAELQKELEGIDITDIAESDVYGDYTISELEEMLEKALMAEDYENAARLRDEISKRTPK